MFKPNKPRKITLAVVRYPNGLAKDAVVKEYTVVARTMPEARRKVRALAKRDKAA